MILKLRPITLCLVLLLAGACIYACAQMNGEAASDWAVVFRDTLQHDVLQFWIDHAVDKQYGASLAGLIAKAGRPITGISPSY